MWSLLDFDKVKNPVVGLIVGVLLGGYVSWNSVTSLHEERLKTLEATKVELERQVTVQAKSIIDKENELVSLRSKLSTQITSGAPVILKPGSDLRNLLAQLNSEIVTKKYDLARYARLEVRSFSEENKALKTDEYIQMEKELQALEEQRDLAVKKLIEILSK